MLCQPRPALWLENATLELVLVLLLVDSQFWSSQLRIANVEDGNVTVANEGSSRFRQKGEISGMSARRDGVGGPYWA